MVRVDVARSVASRLRGPDVQIFDQLLDDGRRGLFALQERRAEPRADSPRASPTRVPHAAHEANAPHHRVGATSEDPRDARKTARRRGNFLANPHLITEDQPLDQPSD
jgi:hypothetical protein